MVASDDHSTSTRFLALLDKVNFIHPFPLVRLPQLLHKVVIAHASCVHHRLGRKDVLSTKELDEPCAFSSQSWYTHSGPSCSVLSPTSSDVRDAILLDDLLVATVSVRSASRGWRSYGMCRRHTSARAFPQRGSRCWVGDRTFPGALLRLGLVRRGADHPCRRAGRTW